MASWRDKMGKASFRGVEFYIDGAELGTGRRGPVHKYPGRDVPYREDTGCEAREFPVEAHVVGDDYLTQKESLLKALEELLEDVEPLPLFSVAVDDEDTAVLGGGDVGDALGPDVDHGLGGLDREGLER